MFFGDTIAAICTSVLPSARIIVRVSGPRAFEILGSLSNGAGREPGVRRSTLLFDDLSLPAWVYSFVAPRSYTGEDVIELHIPGNPLLARMLMQTLLGLGARVAEPGEFTARAYFNRKLDLSQAEGVAASISAGSDRELLAARRLLAGDLTRRLKPVIQSLAGSLAMLEAGIDFSEEDISFVSAAELQIAVRGADQLLAAIVEQTVTFESLAREPHVVLAGRPNAGKSTLLNALSGQSRAVVSPVAGTTRDAIWAEVALPRGDIRLIDVAGIEASDSPSTNDDATPAGSIRRQMRERAVKEIQTADRVLLIVDASGAFPELPLPRRPDLVVRTKADLVEATGAHPDGMLVSARTGSGLDELKTRLDQLCFGPRGQGAETLALNARHRHAIAEARECLQRLLKTLPDQAADELAAFELRIALDSLGSIAGEVTTDDLLGRIFGAFCIGK